MKRNREAILMILLVVAVLTAGGWYLTSVWNECRDHGFSRLYCLKELD